MLSTMARHVAGDYTLNQIRVLQYAHMCWRYRSAPTTHADICRELQLPSATVSRAIGKFIEVGILREELDPADGRRRLVSGTGRLPGSNVDLDRELADFFSRYFR
jgi:DNA-binding MarR family transcriptional regulator